MKSELVKRKQPFGEVDSHRPMGGEGKPHAMTEKPLGGITMRPNNGMDHGPSFADKNPGANQQASAHLDNPFFWSGHPKGKCEESHQSEYSLGRE